LLINNDHRRWVASTAVFVAATTGIYTCHVATTPRPPSGGSAIGLSFGVVATAFMVAAGLLSLRKRRRTWRVGSAQLWMRMHIWLSVAAVPCIWFHSAFGLGGPLTTTLMALFYLVIASGLVGLVLQQWVPSAMTRRVPLETVHSQIADVRAQLAADAYEGVAAITGEIAEAAPERALLATEKEQAKHWKRERLRPRQAAATAPAEQAEELKEVYLTAIRPYLLGARRSAPPDLGNLRRTAPDEWRTALDRLRDLCEEARQLGLQERLHTLLHNWLFLHAPASLALFALIVVHAVYALRYVGF
jgi:hypothetical protein